MTRLVLAAHGSADPRYPWVIEAIAGAVRRTLAGRGEVTVTSVEVGYLDHCLPRLADVVRPGDVVVPLLLSSGYHAAVDIPAMVPADARVTATLGPDPRLADICAERLRESGWQPRRGPVVLAAAGSSDPQAARDVATVAETLGDVLSVEVIPAFLSAAGPRLEEVVGGAAAVASYLIAPGRFADQAAASGAPIVSPVLGAHPLLAEIILDRLATALSDGG